jgi:hypothetical protein
MPRILNPEDLAREAAAFHVEPAALRAVAQVESGGKGGFLPDGRVRLLFERHILWRRLRERGLDPLPFAKARPDLCGEVWDPGRYPYGGGAHQWERVAAVIAWGDVHLDRAESYAKAAWEASSWGLLQVLGENYAAAGFPDVTRFKAAMEESEAAQLRAALNLMARNGALGCLQRRDYVGFARIWNGPGQVGGYAGRLQTAARNG